MRQINKKGDVHMPWILIAFIIAFVVLVVVIIKFTGIWDKATAYFGGNSLTTAGEACRFACTSSNINSYCIEKRTIKGLSETDAKKFIDIGTGDTNVSTDYGVTGTKKGDTWTLSGVTCDALNSEKVILLGECTPPLCG